MNRGRIAFLLVWTGLATVLAACASSVHQQEAPTAASRAVASPAQPTRGATALPESARPSDAPTAQTIRQDQYATDPTTVDLASGRPTLVKFFAFW